MMTVLDDSTGLFPRSQPAWAAHGIATFPVHADLKRPAVKHYEKLGLPASAQLAAKRSFANIDGIGFMAGPRSRKTLLDIDVPDERLLADSLDRHGRTPFIVRTASGKFHLYFKHAGERRRIRPWPDRPIDLLGGGYVVAPPTLVTGKGSYEIIEGRLDDLDRLPVMRNLDLHQEPVLRQEPTIDTSAFGEMVEHDGRNGALFDVVLRAARSVHRGGGTHRQLLEIARQHNLEFKQPIREDSEVQTIVDSAWKITVEGRNRTGQHGAYLPYRDVALLIGTDNDALVLLNWLKASEGPEALFWVANGLAPLVGMSRLRLAAARDRLIELGYIRMVRKPWPKHAALYAWAGSVA